ncbi:MAG: histidine kinase N-terminal 7TM domain-containing protein [Candidatus Margulisiibacteriota bacterium]
MIRLAYYFDLVGLALSLTVIFGITVFVWRQNRRALVNRSFGWLGAAILIWIATTLLDHFCTLPGQADLLIRLSYFGGIIGEIFLVYFVIVFPQGKDIKLVLKLLLFGVAAVFCGLVIFTDIFVAGIVPTGKPYLYLEPIRYGRYHLIYELYSLLLIVGAIGMSVRKLLYYTGVERKSSALLTAAIFIGALATNFFTLWLPRLGVAQFDAIGPISLIVPFLLVAYAIARYRLFLVTPQVAAADILRSLGDRVLVCDLNGEVLYRGAAGEPLPAGVIGELIREVVARDAVDNYYTQLGPVMVSLSARFLTTGGGIVIVIHDINELEKEAAELKKAQAALHVQLEKTRKIRELLTAIARTNEPGAAAALLDKIRQEQQLGPQDLTALSRMAELAGDRQRLLAEIEADQRSLAAKLPEVTATHKAGVQRELEMIELKKQIQALKEAKGI